MMVAIKRLRVAASLVCLLPFIFIYCRSISRQQQRVKDDQVFVIDTQSQADYQSEEDIKVEQDKKALSERISRHNSTSEASTDEHWLDDIKTIFPSALIAAKDNRKLRRVAKICSSNDSLATSYFGETDRKGRRVAFVYARSCCREAKRTHCASALAAGHFDVCVSLNETALDADFRRRNAHILRQKRGGGYWIWKPYILSRAAALMRRFDFFMYADAASTWLQPVDEYICRLIQRNASFAAQHMKPAHKVIPKDATNNQYIKQDTFVLLDAERFRYDMQHDASSFGMLNVETYGIDPTLQGFLSAWLTYVQDERAVTDKSSQLEGGEKSTFKDHRHDQAIFSLLAFKWNVTELPQITQYGDWEQSKHVWLHGPLLDHHRKKGSKVLQDLGFYDYS